MSAIAGIGREDDWMVQAMKSYENLYMFELPQPTQCIEWSQQGTGTCQRSTLNHILLVTSLPDTRTSNTFLSIFVAGCSPDLSSEITQLALPGKLLPIKNETHWAKRDFQLINGAFSSSPVKTMKYLHNTDVLASAGDKPIITLWKTDEQNSDCLTETGTLDLHLPSNLQPSCLKDSLIFIDAASDHPATVLTGSSLCLATVQTTDITTGKPSFTLNSTPPDTHLQLHGLSYVTMATDLIVTSSGQNGDIDIWDTRVSGGGPVTMVTTTETTAGLGNAATVTVTVTERDPISQLRLFSREPNPSHSQAFSFSVSHDSHPGMKLALLRASTGVVQLFDSRQPRTMCACSQTNSLSEGGGAARSWFRRTPQAPCVKFGPYNTSLLSVSGCTAGVKVYDTANWTCNIGVAAPLFTHTGHEDESPSVQVSVHSWQPDVQSTILSADTDGSLHAWQWKK